MSRKIKQIIKHFSKRTGIPGPFEKSNIPLLDRFISLEEWLDHRARGGHGKLDEDMLLLKKIRKLDNKKFLNSLKENY